MIVLVVFGALFFAALYIWLCGVVWAKLLYAFDVWFYYETKKIEEKMFRITKEVSDNEKKVAEINERSTKESKEKIPKEHNTADD